MSLVLQAEGGNSDKKSEFNLSNDAVILTGHQGPVLSSKFSPNGHSIITSGLDRQILLWSLPTQAEEAPNYGVLPGHKAGVTSVTWRLQSTIFSTSADSTVAFWDSETGQKTRKGVGHELTVNDSAASDNGIYVSAGDDGTLRVWDEREKNAVRIIHTSNPLISCAIKRDGSIAYAGGIDTNIQAFDISTGQVCWSHGGAEEGITGLDLSHDESMLAAKAMDGSVYTLNTKNHLPGGISRAGFTYEGTVANASQFASKARFTRDDVYIGSGSEDGSLIVWSNATSRMVSKFSDHQKAVVDVDFHPFADIMVSCGSGGEVVVREY